MNETTPNTKIIITLTKIVNGFFTLSLGNIVTP